MVPREDIAPPSPAGDSKSGAGGSSLGVQLTEALSAKQLLEQKMHDLDSNYNSVCDENERLRQNYKEKQNEVLTLQENMEDFSEQVHSLEDTGKRLEAEYAALDQQNTETKAALLAAHESIKVGQAKQETLETKLAAKDVECESLQSKLEATIIELNSDKDIILSQKEKLEAMTVSCKDMEARMTAMQITLNDKETIAAASDARNVELDSTLQKQIEITELVKKETVVLEDKLKALELLVAAANEEVKEGHAKYTVLQASLATKEADYDVQAGRFSALESNFDAKVAELQSANAVISSKESDIVALTDSRKAMEDKISALQGDNDDKEKIVNLRDAHIVELEESLQQQLVLTENCKSDISKMQSNLDSQQDRLSVSMQSIDEEKSNNEMLQGQLAGKTAECVELQTTLSTLSDNLTLKIDEIKVLKDLSSHQEDQLDSLSASSKRMEDQICKLQVELDEKNKAASACASLITDLETKLKEQTASSEASSDENARLVKDHKSEVQALEESAAALTAQFDGKSQEVERLLVVEANLTSDVAVLKAKVEGLTSDIHEMEATLMAGNSTGEEKLTAVLEAKMEMEERYAVVVAESNASLALQREHEETIRSLKANVDKYVAEIEKLADKIAAKEKEERERAVSFDELAAELAAAKVDLADKEKDAACTSSIVSELKTSDSILKEKILHLESANASSSNRVESLSEKVGALQVQLDAKSKKIESCQALLDQKEEEVKHLLTQQVTSDNEASLSKKSIDDLRTRILDKEKTLTLQEEKLAIADTASNAAMTLQREHEEIIRSLKASDIENMVEIEKLSARLAAKEEEVRQRAATCDELLAELAAVKVDLTNSEKETERIKSTVLQLQDEVSLLTSAKDEAKASVVRLQGDLTKIQQSWDEEVVSLSGEAKIKAAQVEKLNQTVANEEAKNLTLESRLKEIEESVVSGQSSAVASLDALKVESSAKEKAFQDEIDVKNQEIKALSDSMQASSAEMKVLRDENLTVNSDIELSKKAVLEMESEMSKLVSSLKESEAANTGSIFRIKELEGFSQSLQQDLLSSENIITSANAEKETLRAQIADKIAECESQSSTIDVLRAELATNIASLEVTDGERDKELEALSASSKRMEDQISKLQVELDEKNKAASACASLITDLETKLKEQTASSEASSDENARLVKDHKSEVQALEESAAALTAQFDGKSQEVERLLVVEANLTSDVAVLKAKVEGLTSDIHEMEATLMAGNSTGEEKLTAVLEAKMEMEERYAVVVAESNASLALQREHEETIRSLKADIIREETLEKTRHAKLVSEKDDLQYDLSIVSDKLRIAEGHLEENDMEIQALVAKKESIEQLYNEKLQQSGTSDESSRKENLELTNQLRIAHENHQQTLKEAQEEIAELISTVVESKLNAATHATEVDEVKQKMKALKQRLQVYAQRVATLEVAVAEANSVPNSEEDDNSYGFTTAIRRYTGFLK